MTITESNLLIALFDGWQPVGDRLVKHSERETRIPEHLFYHFQWNWLMPVVDRIESLKAPGRYIICQVTITSHICHIHYNAGNVTVQNLPVFEIDQHRSDTETKIENVYSAVVQFIQWYNQYKPITNATT